MDEKTREQLRADLQKACGKDSTLPEVNRVLDGLPDAVDKFGDFAAYAAETLIELAAGKHLLTREALKRKVAALSSEVAGPRPSPLERLLAERIAACWLQVSHADLMCANNLGKSSLEMGDFLRRRQDSAHKRYTSAILALARVRRLLTPIVQVNVAQQQLVSNTLQAAGG